MVGGFLVCLIILVLCAFCVALEKSYERKEYRRDTKLAVDCLIPSTILYFLVMGGALTVLTHLGILG